jgi:Uma2 family endonuclease
MAEITSLSQLNLDGYYTYQDYLTWKFKERVELFKGVIAKMSPAPNRRHQEISGFLAMSIYNYLQGKPCKAYTAPFDVRLPVSNKEGKVDTVVQPDICVVCNLDLLDEQGCNGAQA